MISTADLILYSLFQRYPQIKYAHQLVTESYTQYHISKNLLKTNFIIPRDRLIRMHNQIENRLFRRISKEKAIIKTFAIASECRELYPPPYNI